MKRPGLLLTAVTLLCALALQIPTAAQEKPATQQQTAGAPAVAPAAAPTSQAKLVAQMPGGTATKPYHFPPVASKTLANGLRVFVVTSRAMPAVSVRLVITSAGAVNDPEGKSGLASLTASLLTQGTDTRTAEQIAEAIDFVGGSLSASAGDDGTFAECTVVKKDFDLGMDLLSDVILHANFKQDEIERQRQQLLSNLQVNYDDPDYLASAAIQRVLFAAHPYGLPNEGTPTSVNMLTRDDLVHFRDASYLPGTAMLAFSGDVDPDVAFAAAQNYFGGWQKKPAPPAAPPVTASLSGIHIYVIDKPDAVQTQIRVGKPGIRRADPDFIPLFVADRVFGGGYNSRLN
ncbi:MAG: M16 family metallopeptidase, partial [Bryobacteraceae bacterium]